MKVAVGRICRWFFFGVGLAMIPILERYSKPSYFGSPRARLGILRNFATRRKR
jgi:hypothetical protein